MPLIQIKTCELNSRGNQIRHLLEPLSRLKEGPACQLISTQGVYIIGAHDGSPSKSHYRDWRFPTFVPYFRGMYFECWKKYNDEFGYLDRAYLTIFRINPSTREEVEFLCLHCDPNEPDNADHALYKQGPHLHIQAADDPIPHAHIALNRGHLEEVLNSVDSLSEAISWAVLMLKQEILDELNKVKVAS